jgi:hypothetical protein
MYWSIKTNNAEFYLPGHWFASSGVCPLIETCCLNPLAPSDPYMGRTAQLTSRRCTLNTYSTNIRTKYFKCAA